MGSHFTHEWAKWHIERDRHAYQNARGERVVREWKYNAGIWSLLLLSDYRHNTDGSTQFFESSVSKLSWNLSCMGQVAACLRMSCGWRESTTVHVDVLSLWAVHKYWSARFDEKHTIQTSSWCRHSTWSRHKYQWFWRHLLSSRAHLRTVDCLCPLVLFWMQTYFRAPHRPLV